MDKLNLFVTIWAPNASLYDWHYILHLGHLADAFIRNDLQEEHLSEERETIYHSYYSKDIHNEHMQSIYNC